MFSSTYFDLPKRATSRAVIQNQKGYTITSMVMTLVIIAVLAATAGINLLDQLPKYRLNGATRKVAWDLMAIRMEAIRDKHSTTVTFSSSHEYTIWADKDNDSNVDSGEQVQKDIWSDYPDVSISSTANPVFTSTGQVTNPTNISVTNSMGTKSVTVSSAGMIKLN